MSATKLAELAGVLIHDGTFSESPEVVSLVEAFAANHPRAAALAAAWDARPPEVPIAEWLRAQTADLAFKGAATDLSLTALFGAVLGAIMKPGVAVKDISPLVWQPHIGNSALTKVEKQAIEDANPGKSKSWYDNKKREFRKERTKDWVTTTYGLQVPTDNQSDAIAISHVGVDMFC